MSWELLHRAPVAHDLQGDIHDARHTGRPTESIDDFAGISQRGSHGNGIYKHIVRKSKKKVWIDCGSPLDDNLRASNQGDSAMPESVNPDPEAVARRCRLLREAHEYTNQRRWAAFLGKGITFQDVNNWEKMVSLPSTPKLRVLTLRTGVKADWVLWGDRTGMPVGLMTMIDEEERRQAAEAAQEAEEPGKRSA
jgi:hypothetical protein